MVNTERSRLHPVSRHEGVVDGGADDVEMSVGAGFHEKRNVFLDGAVVVDEVDDLIVFRVAREEVVDALLADFTIKSRANLGATNANAWADMRRVKAQIGYGRRGRGIKCRDLDAKDLVELGGSERVG